MNSVRLNYSESIKNSNRYIKKRIVDYMYLRDNFVHDGYGILTALFV